MIRNLVRSFRLPESARHKPARRIGYRAELERLEDRLNLTPSWEPAVALTPNAQINGDFLQADGPTLHFAYVTGGNLYYRRSLDEGLTWTHEQVVTSARAFYPTKSGYVDGAGIHLVFERNGSGVIGTGDIYYIRSLDGGNTWGGAQLLAVNDLRPLGYFFRASIVAAGSSVHVVWANHYFQSGVPGSNDTTGIYYRRSLDGGGTWGPAELLVDEANNPGRPELMASGDVVYVGWSEEQKGAPPYMQFARAPEIYFLRSTDRGGTWGAPVRISYDLPGFSARAELAKFGPSPNGASDTGTNAVIITWEDSRDDDQLEVYYSRSTDFGATWEPEQRLTFAPGLSTHPVSSGLGSLVQVSWADGRDGNLELYYKLSLDGAETWLADERLSFTAGATYAGRNTITANYVHVTYSDGGTNRVYYRRGGLGRGQPGGGPSSHEKLDDGFGATAADATAGPVSRALIQAIVSPATGMTAAQQSSATAPDLLRSPLGTQPSFVEGQTHRGGAVESGSPRDRDGASFLVTPRIPRTAAVEGVFQDTSWNWAWSPW